MATTVGTIELLATIDTSQYKRGAREIDKANEDMEDSTHKVERSNERAESSFISLAKRGIKFAAVGMAALAATVLGMAAKGGFDRALNIEDAQAKLRGLGHDAETVETIMTNALASVRGTAFGLDAAATTAANAVASGIRPGQQLEQVLKTVANSAALAGADMSELGSIFNKVAAANKVQMDVINQLQDRGIPVLQFLAKELGLTAEETAKMASEGKINFETFERAMREGVGNAALEMGNTTRGSLANMQAAFSRAGAVIADRVLPHIRDGIQSITGWVDSVAKAIPGIIDVIIDNFSRISEAVTGVGDSIAAGDTQALGETIGSGIAKGLNNAIAAIGITMETIGKWFEGIDWGQLGLDIGKQSIAFLVGFFIGLLDFDLEAAWKTLSDNWLPALLGVLSLLFLPAKLIGPIGKFLSKLPFADLFNKIVIQPLRNLGKPVRDAVAGLFNNLGGTIGKAFSNIGNLFKTLGQIIISPFRIAINFIAEQITFLPLTISNGFRAIVNIIRNTLGLLINVVRTIFTTLWNVITTILRPFTEFFTNLFRAIWNNISGIFTGAGNFFATTFLRARSMIQDVFGGIVNWFLGRWQAITNIFSRVGSWFSARFTDAVNGIKRVFNTVVGFFRDTWNRITSMFGNVGTTIGNTIGNAFRSAINGILRFAVNIINGFIRAINAVVDTVNNIPGVNIGRLGELPIPQLAEGGIVASATLAVIGEGREPEAVIPLSKLDEMLDGDGGGSGTTYNITIQASANMLRSETDKREFANMIFEAFNQDRRAKSLPQIGTTQ